MQGHTFCGCHACLWRGIGEESQLQRGKSGALHARGPADIRRRPQALRPCRLAGASCGDSRHVCERDVRPAAAGARSGRDGASRGRSDARGPCHPPAVQDVVQGRQVGTVHRLAACPAEQDSGRQGKYRRRARSLRKPGKSPRRADAELPRQPHGSRRRGGPAARGRMAEEVRRAHAGGVRARFPSPLDGPHHGSRRTSRRARVCVANGKLRAGVAGRRGSRRR